MFGFHFQLDDTTDRVAKAADKAAFRNFNHAAAAIRKDVQSTLERAEGPSAPGTPPHTHKGNFLRRAIRFAADAAGAVIGPAFSMVGTAGEAHEFGGDYKGHDFPEREFIE